MTPEQIKNARQWLNQLEVVYDAMPKLTEEMKAHNFLLCELGIVLGALLRAERIIREDLEAVACDPGTHYPDVSCAKCETGVYELGE